MHYGRKIIRSHSTSIPSLRHPKLVFLSLLDVLPKNSHETAAISSLVFMKEAKRMTNLVHDDRFLRV
jgi:hypothetical protein